MVKKKGFTLIELLVVIAIIGILASIVLVSLSGARNRARDARIISDMGQLRTVATIFNDNNGTYTGLDADTEVVALEADIEGVNCGSQTLTWQIDGATGFCATATLNGGGYWCIDSDLTSEKDADGTITACVAGCDTTDTCLCD